MLASPEPVMSHSLSRLPGRAFSQAIGLAHWADGFDPTLSAAVTIPRSRKTRLTIEAEEIMDAWDSVVVAVLQRGVGGGSGAATEFRYFHLWSFRGPKVIRLENFRHRAEALEAAGLRE